MSGHSKWNTIKRKKEKTDAQRGKIFTKIGREIMVAVKEGGADPETNFKLKDSIAKAKANNVPNENILRTIKKASGSSGTQKYESIRYEGYGPSGVAVIVDSLTENKNRTAADLRHYFDKYGGNLGTTGCVSFMFLQKGVIIIEKETEKEEDLMVDALDSGAEDFLVQEDFFEIQTLPEDFRRVKTSLENKGYKIIDAQLEMIPSTYTEIKDQNLILKMQKLLEALEDNDDVQDVFHNLKQD